VYAALSGEAVQPAPKVTQKNTIALFPQEWMRDPESPFLQSAYHDVPWEEPELVLDCVNSRRKQSGWYARRRKQTSKEVHSTKQMVAAAENCLKAKSRYE
jgi:hypothetical protein